MTIDQLVEQARQLLPALRERAARTEALRRIPDETIADLREAGLFRVFQPARFGGYELDYGTTQLALAGTLGTACGSSAWVQSVLACHAWVLGMFPPAAQEAVWGKDPEALIATSFASSNGTARPVEGGYVIEGQWQFSSGIDAADWVMLNVPLASAPGARYGRFFLVSRAQFEIVDTWFAAGLKGTGSKDVRVPATFVPEEHTLDPLQLKGGPSPGSMVNPSYIYRIPIGPLFSYNVLSPAIGIARGAVQAYAAQNSGRPERAGQQTRQLRIAASAAEIDAAHALLERNALEAQRVGRAGGPFPLEAQLRWLRDIAFAAQLCVRAVDRLALNAGAHGMLDNDPLQRALRDVHAVANHAGLSWDAGATPFGRVALGLEPGDPRF